MKKIVVYKSRRVLELWEDTGEVVQLPVGVGRGSGQKEREGDLRTPEGEYVICVKNPKSSFHLSLGLSYPNSRDALRGLAARRVSWREMLAIISANWLGKRPPWKTNLGGEIYLHGNLEKSPSTRGCISLNDADIESFFSRVPIGTKVLIKP